MRARRRDVHDASPACLDHVGQYRLDTVEDAVEVDVDDALPFVERNVGEFLEAVEAGRIDQDGHRPQLCPDRSERGLDLCSISNVRRMRELVLGGVEVDRGDVIAIRAQTMDDRLPDARAASSDDSRLHRRFLSANGFEDYRERRGVRSPKVRRPTSTKTSRSTSSLRLFDAGPATPAIPAYTIEALTSPTGPGSTSASRANCRPISSLHSGLSCSAVATLGSAARTATRPRLRTARAA